MKTDLKFLLVDTEWSYAIGYFFPSKHEQFIPARNIKHHQFCTNASYKYRGEKRSKSISILDDKKQFKQDFRNSKIIAVTLHKVMSEADVIVAHNLIEFDLRMLNNIFKLYKLGPIPEKKFIDTLKEARKHFRFAGNGLDDLLHLFGYKGKAKKPCWIQLSEGNPNEIKKSIKYCNRDVDGLGIILEELIPFMKNLPKPRTQNKDHYGIEKCDACGSKKLHNKGLDGPAGKVYPRVKCSECGHNMKGNMKLWRKAHGKETP